jgi:hypothetical protein
MGLAPLVRAAGSSLTLRYRGLVTEGDDAGVYPIDPVVYPADSHIDGASGTFLAAGSARVSDRGAP